MIAFSRYLLLLPGFILVSSFASAQIDTSLLNNFKPPLNRQLFHGYVDAEQRNALKYDGKADNKLVVSSNEEVNFLVTKALTTNVDWLQYKIEKDSLLNHTKKLRYLRGLQNLLKNLQKGWREKQISPVYLPATIDAYDNCMQLDKKGLTIENYIYGLDYEIANPIVRSTGFDDNPGIRAARNELIRKYCLLHPDQTFYILKDNPDVSFADSLIRAVSQKYPRQLYDYAQANSKLGYMIRNINDDVFIKSVARMARSKSGQQYFPFLDNIVKGKMSFDEIDAVKDDSIKYYKLLVKTQMEYVERALNKDTAFEFASLTGKLEKKAQSVFVNTINGLHEIDNPAIRFRIIQPLNAEELYYLAVCSDGIIYTSSYTKGVYPLMMKKINQRGDSLLMRVRFDKYRKFIKMAAGYNTLGNFLNTFPARKNPDDESDAEKLMKAFVGKLEISDGLEAGVDVADSYASIAESLKPLANEMLKNVQWSYKRNEAANNRRGLAIYNILYKLFLSADTANHIDLTKELGIPPVYGVPYRNLVNDSGRVVMQVFFYGEKSDMEIFTGFVDMFRNANWKITANPLWVCITSAKGKPVSIYANRALPQEDGQDEKAQQALVDYLEKNKLYPTITIHRGHSYTAPYTIEQMFPTSKIVFLGSCGGYNLIHDVLVKAPDAHIIASKQIGKTAVNRPFFQLLTEKLRNGNNIDWIPFWQELEKLVTVEGFEDYIPPYKNLGALYIKAYKKAMGEGDEKTEF
ncbi:MAG TPA: hypothetical protein VKC90_11935 [Chitinophagaceae bacterium]|nr:hypothetical protein [Chitinophagaceae bacterium]